MSLSSPLGQAMFERHIAWRHAGSPQGQEPWRWLQTEGAALYFAARRQGIPQDEVVWSNVPQMQAVIDELEARFIAQQSEAVKDAQDDREN